MSPLSYMVYLSVLTLTESSILLDDPSISYNFSSSELLLSTTEMENLKRILNYISDAPEFFPLTLSIVIPEFQSNVADFLSQYIANNPINVYTVRANDLATRGTWKNEIHLTWIIFVDDVYSLNTFIHWQEDLWKATNQYLIVFTDEIVTIPWRRIFENLWKLYNVYRVIIASVQDDFECLMKYLPYDLPRKEFGGLYKVCLKENANSAVQMIQQNERKGSPKKQEDIDGIFFADKDIGLFESFQDLKNHFMDIIVFTSMMMNVSYNENRKMKLSMLDADVLKVLEKAMKVNFRVKALGKPDVLNGEDPFDLAFKDIESGKVEIVITGFFTKKYHGYRKYEFTSTVYEDKLCFITPSSGLVPKSYMPLLPFEKYLWLLLIMYNITITVIWFVVKYLSKSFHDQKRAVPIMSSSWLENAHGIIMNVSETRSEEIPHSSSQPSPLHASSQAYTQRFNDLRESRKTQLTNPPEIHPCVLACFDFAETFCYPFQIADTAAQKAFLFGTLFFGLIVTGLYQSYLVSSLSNPFHYPELTTVEDVVKSGKTIITKYSNLRRTFVDDTPLGRQLSRQIKVVNLTTPTNHLVAYKKMIAIARYASVKLEDLSIYYDKEGHKLLHVVEECPATYSISYVMRLYSPYRERINTILLRMQETGFVKLWYEKMIYPVEAMENRRKVRRSERKIKLTLEHYTLTFLLLFVGLFGSTLVFLGEMYYAKRLSC